MNLATRFDRLSRGANVGGWFWNINPVNPQPFKAKDFAIMRGLGLTYVRLPIDFSFLYDATAPNLLKASRLAQIDRAIAQIQSYGLAVMVDLHSTPSGDDTNYSGALENPAFIPIFIQFWNALAAHLQRTTNPENTFIQPMNEPIFLSNPSAWLPIQQQLIQTIRAQAPRHTIVATNAPWQSLDSLIQLQPLPDPNLVYDFHFYEPFVFTHQGAEWIDTYVQQLQGVPYPSTPENVTFLPNQLPGNTVARNDLLYYGQERWNRDKIRERIALVDAWAKRNGVRVISTEFGVYNKVAPAGDRVRWMEDVRHAFDDYGIGWATWGYTDGFGYVTWRNTVPYLDQAMVRALGLNTILEFNGTAQSEVLRGTSLPDLVDGLAGHDQLVGFQGNDVLLGGPGRDRLAGGVGRDHLRGGRGPDTLIGGAGADVFVLERDRSRDTIQDFTVGQDRLGLTPGLRFFQLRLTQIGPDTLIRVGGEAIALLKETSTFALTAGDFMRVK